MRKNIVNVAILLLGMMNASKAKNMLIESLSITKNRLDVTVHKKLRTKYLRENFFAHYDSDINLHSLDQSIVIIPFLAAIAPVVWLSGETYYVECIDDAFARSLEKIRNTLKTFYPSIQWSGQLIAERVVDNKSQAIPQKSCTNEIALLFSAGVDAVCSSFVHHTQKQLLISIWGSDIVPRNTTMWHGAKKTCEAFAETHEHACAFVKSNFLTFLNSKRLSSVSREIPKWWSCTSQGLGYCGLAAPIVISHGYQKLLIASTHTKEFSHPHGTHPLIDNNIAFGPAVVEHDCFELERQEKIHFIVDFAKAHSIKKPFLRVCWGRSPHGGNCANCEKCLRTITGLLIEGEEPREYGFNIAIPEAIARIKQNFTAKKRSFRLQHDTVFFWEKMQQHCKAIVENKTNAARYPQEIQDFFTWLGSINIHNYDMHKYVRFRHIDLAT